MGCIYLARNKVNGKRYIGQTKVMLNRKASHKYGANNSSNTYFHNALRKYGFDAFEWSVLFDDVDEKDLNSVEIAMIRLLKTKAPNGYNLTDGGEGLKNPSEETRKKLKRIAEERVVSPETGRKISLALTGLRRSVESRKRLSDALTGLPKSKEHRANLSKANMGKNKGKTYEELYGIEKALELRQLRILEVTGRKHSEASKLKMSETRKGKSFIETYGVEQAKAEKDKRARPMERWWAVPENRKKMMEAREEARRGKEG